MTTYKTPDYRKDAQKWNQHVAESIALTIFGSTRPVGVVVGVADNDSEYISGVLRDAQLDKILSGEIVADCSPTWVVGAWND